ncbi:hypothetical protein [Aliivibrio sp. EL58]|uniref:hypothetical protein n=1 Tax=Aliivibrio sp. EL58 TaxID=2107582 RepID=UPI000EFA793D|nr:hypothetical protein [Aliivibrio sp. EL58]
MTFVVNILNKDFSLIASDKRANTTGPTTIKMGNITINAENGATIDGYKKIYTNESNSFAAGIAGVTDSHSYAKILESTADINLALRNIREHMESFLDVNNREKLLEMNSLTENQGVITFFDGKTDTYFSNFYLFSEIHNYTRLFARSEEGTRLIHIGSGSSHFESIFSTEEVNSFIESISGTTDIERVLLWLNEVFGKVSDADDSVSSEFVAYVSTREIPEFIEVTNS